MKKVFPFLFVVLCSHAVLGQRSIATVPYGDQFVQLCSLYAKEPDDVSNLIDMATFFSQPDNPQFSLPQAYGYIARAEEVFTKWLDDKDHYRDLQKLIRRGVSIATIRQQRADIQAAATAYVKAHVWEMDASETSVYEELLALKRSFQTLGLTKEDLEDVMFNNAFNLIDGASKDIYGKPFVF